MSKKRIFNVAVIIIFLIFGNIHTFSLSSDISNSIDDSHENDTIKNYINQKRKEYSSLKKLYGEYSPVVLKAKADYIKYAQIRANKQNYGNPSIRYFLHFLEDLTFEEDSISDQYYALYELADAMVLLNENEENLPDEGFYMYISQYAADLFDKMSLFKPNNDTTMFDNRVLDELNLSKYRMALMGTCGDINLSSQLNKHIEYVQKYIETASSLSNDKFKSIIKSPSIDYKGYGILNYRIIKQAHIKKQIEKAKEKFENLQFIKSAEILSSLRCFVTTGSKADISLVRAITKCYSYYDIELGKRYNNLLDALNQLYPWIQNESSENPLEESLSFFDKPIASEKISYYKLNREINNFWPLEGHEKEYNSKVKQSFDLAAKIYGKDSDITRKKRFLLSLSYSYIGDYKNALSHFDKEGYDYAPKQFLKAYYALIKVPENNNRYKSISRLKREIKPRAKILSKLAKYHFSNIGGGASIIEIDYDMFSNLIQQSDSLLSPTNPYLITAVECVLEVLTHNDRAHYNSFGLFYSNLKGYYNSEREEEDQKCRLLACEILRRNLGPTDSSYLEYAAKTIWCMAARSDSNLKFATRWYSDLRKSGCELTFSLCEGLTACARVFRNAQRHGLAISSNKLAIEGLDALFYKEGAYDLKIWCLEFLADTYSEVGLLDEAVKTYQLTGIGSLDNYDIEKDIRSYKHLSELLIADKKYDKAWELAKGYLESCQKYSDTIMSVLTRKIKEKDVFLQVRKESARELLAEHFFAHAVTSLYTLSQIADLKGDDDEKRKWLTHPLWDICQSISKHLAYEKIWKENPAFIRHYRDMASILLYSPHSKNESRKKGLNLLEELVNVLEEAEKACSFPFDEKLVFDLETDRLIIDVQKKNEGSIVVHQKALIDKYQGNLIENFRSMTSNEKYSFLQKFERLFYRNINATAMIYNKNSELTAMAYDNALFTKGLLLRSEVALHDLIKATGDSVALNLLEKYESIARQIDETPTTQKKKLIERKRDIEHQLAEISADFGNYTAELTNKWQDVAAALNDDEAAVEFIESNGVLAAVSIQRKSKTPSCTSLFVGRALLRNDALRNMSHDQLYATDTIKKIIWEPVLKSLDSKCKTIYFSPTGALHNIAVEYARCEDGKRMNDKYNMVRLSSTREIINGLNHLEINGNNLAFGNIDYNADSDDNKLEHNNNESTRSFDSEILLDNASTQRYELSPLPQTLIEIESLKNIFEHAGAHMQLTSGNMATEASFKEQVKTKPKILHVATHGFYWTEKEAKLRRFNNPLNTIDKEEASLMRSGLMFAGATHTMSKPPILTNGDNGILTAHEISRLDLKGVELVALSACQTALGDISQEGVAGLQRAFKKAGASSLLMSLWKVDDTATRILMEQFYRNLATGHDRHKALKLAQDSVSDIPNYSAPYYWAGFILID